MKNDGNHWVSSKRGVIFYFSKMSILSSLVKKKKKNPELLICHLLPVMDWMFLSPPNSDFEAPPPMWLYLEIELSWRLLRLNEILRVGPWSDRIHVLIRKNWPIYLPTMWGLDKKEAVYKRREEASEWNLPRQHLDLRLPGSRTVRNKHLFSLKPPNPWYFVMAAWAKTLPLISMIFIPLENGHLCTKGECIVGCWSLELGTEKKDNRTGNYLFSVISPAISIVPGI